MKLELKHLAPYLPYNIKVELSNGNIHSLSLHDMPDIMVNGIKPIMRPLSDLNTDIEMDGKKFNPLDNIHIDDLISFEEDRPLQIDSLEHPMTYYTLLKLLEWHIDVFGLIDEGLAIDINTLK